MYFSDTPSQKEFEKLMQGVPNFAPRGHGSFIPKAQPALCERSQPPPASLSDAMERTLSRVNCPPFHKRLKQYLKEREKTPMDYRNEKHRIAFAEAIEKLNQKDYALMSAVYLLTAEHALWMKAKCKVEKNGILFDTIKLQNSTENAYILFCCAKDLYLGTKHITLICGGIGAGAQNALAQTRIKLYGGVSGSADDAVNSYSFRVNIFLNRQKINSRTKILCVYIRRCNIARISAAFTRKGRVKSNGQKAIFSHFLSIQTRCLLFHCANGPLTAIAGSFPVIFFGIYKSAASVMP